MAGYFHAQRLLALCLAWLVVGAALAQDPKASAAQAAARDWLALVDRSDAQASWNAASKKFQEAMPVSGWADALAKARDPLGPAKGRTRLRSRATGDGPSSPCTAEGRRSAIRCWCSI